MHFEFEHFPIPPSENKMYATVPARGKLIRVKSKDFRLFEQQYNAWGIRNRADIKQFREHIQKYPNTVYALRITLFWRYERMYTKKDGAPKRIDPLNRAGSIQDAIAKIIGIDDSLFRKTCIEAVLSGNDETCKITIEPHSMEDLATFEAML